MVSALSSLYAVSHVASDESAPTSTMNQRTRVVPEVADNESRVERTQRGEVPDLAGHVSSRDFRGEPGLVDAAETRPHQEAKAVTPEECADAPTSSVPSESLDRVRDTHAEAGNAPGTGHVQWTPDPSILIPSVLARPSGLD